MSDASITIDKRETAKKDDPRRLTTAFVCSSSSFSSSSVYNLDPKGIMGGVSDRETGKERKCKKKKIRSNRLLHFPHKKPIDRHHTAEDGPRTVLVARQLPSPSFLVCILHPLVYFYRRLCVCRFLVTRPSATPLPSMP